MKIKIIPPFVNPNTIQQLYLDNNMLLSKCFFCGDKLIGEHKCKALYPPEIKKTKSKESKKRSSWWRWGFIKENGGHENWINQ